MNSFTLFIRKNIKILLFFTALTPLVVSDFLYFFPFVFGKALFYRMIIEVALILFLAHLLMQRKDPSGKFSLNHSFLKHPIFVSTALFFASAVLSTLFAVNAYRAFFGDMQRGEGFFGLAHYFAFFLIALFIFTKEDWNRFFKALLLVGAVSILYAWLQYFDVSKFPFALNVARQPGSFAGNPSFLASYLILLLGISAAVGFSSSQRLWRYASLLTFLASLATIFLTAVRGAILGVIVGAVFLSLANIKKYRVIGISILVFIMLFVATFWFTRTSPLWLQVPGLGRFTTVSLDNPSVITRLIALKVSWHAFREKPIVGWGLENYNIAYNKYYDPLYALYAEDWFDRAHNRIADIMVMQGVLGLITYAGIFISLFYLLSRALSPLGRSTRVFLAASLVAYFVQNLFLFDQYTSYIPFFAILGYCIAHDERSFAFLDSLWSRFVLWKGKVSSRILGKIRSMTAVASILFLFYGLYSYNYLLAHEAIQFRDTMKLKVGEKIFSGADTFLVPYTFMQSEIRGKFIEILYDSHLVGKKGFEPLVDKALHALEEVVAREPYEPRHYSRLIESYNEIAKEDPSIYAKTEVFARKAVALSPKRQGLLSHLAFILAGEERYDEAIATAKEIVVLEPRSAKGHYQVAIALMLAADSEKIKGTKLQKEYRAEAERELDLTRELGKSRIGSGEPYTGTDLTNSQYYLFLESDMKNMVILYRTMGRPEKMAEILEVLINFHPNNQDYLYDGIIVYRALHNKEKIIHYAEELKRLDSSLANDMDIIIDLASKENWEILDTL